MTSQFLLLDLAVHFSTAELDSAFVEYDEEFVIDA